MSLRRPLVTALALALVLFSSACGVFDTDSPDLAPPGATTGLSAMASGPSIVLSWSNPSDLDFALVMIVRYQGVPPDGLPLRGVDYLPGAAIGSGVVVFVGLAEGAFDSAPVVCAVNTYEAWTRDDHGNWSIDPQLVAVASGTASAPPTAPPTALGATASAGRINLGWTNPAPSPAHRVTRVVRKLGSAPTGPTDGAIVSAALTTSTSESLRPYLPGDVLYYAAYACNECGQCETAGSAASITLTVMQCLQGGGYVLQWRHASATVCSDQLGLGTAATTMVPGWWRSCDSNCATATARQRNAQGVIESVTIGNDLLARGVPFGRVISSEFCRCFQTADDMALGPVVEQRLDISYFVGDELNRCNATLALVSQAPAAGSNTAIVGHAGNTCPPFSNLAWGEAAIHKPDGAGGATYIARVPWDDWASLP